jgi:hypothetical protein
MARPIGAVHECEERTWVHADSCQRVLLQRLPILDDCELGDVACGLPRIVPPAAVLVLPGPRAEPLALAVDGPHGLNVPQLVPVRAPR